MTRYAAKLLFQFRVKIMADTRRRQRRTCEERIINFRARSAGEALASAKRSGKEAQFAYRNADGNPVVFEFVGILDLMSLGPEASAREVWYEIRDRLSPMERRSDILPSEHDLLAQLAAGRR